MIWSQFTANALTVQRCPKPIQRVGIRARFKGSYLPKADQNVPQPGSTLWAFQAISLAFMLTICGTQSIWSGWKSPNSSAYSRRIPERRKKQEFHKHIRDDVCSLKEGMYFWLTCVHPQSDVETKRYSDRLWYVTLCQFKESHSLT